MKKQLLLSMIFVLLMAGCGANGSANTATKVQPITLTETEMKEVGTNSNAAAQLLVRKAILKEMGENKYTEQEKKELEEIKKNVELEYFLNKKAMESVKVDDMEVLQVYQNNIDKLKDTDIVQVLPQLKDQMLLQRREEAKVNYMNSLVEKYDLNSEIKKRFPEVEKSAEEIKSATEETAKQTVTTEKVQNTKTQDTKGINKK